jgi:Putative transposase
MWCSRCRRRSAVWRCRTRARYRILFRAASEALLSIAADPRHLGASIGFLAVLHTWGQNLHLHPHLHCVVPGGGISPDGQRWIGCKSKSFFLPVRVLSARFRNLFLRYLRSAFEDGKLKFHGEMAGLNRPSAFELMCRQARRAKWVVFAKPPFGGPEQVLKYLARYTHRVAISNQRLVSIEDGHVQFEYKDYADSGKTKVMTLAATEFIRRFLLHVLPGGFMRIRQFGFLANRQRGKKLALCRALLRVPAPSIVAPRLEHKAAASEPKVCPACGVGHLVLIRLSAAVPEPHVPRVDSS